MDKKPHAALNKFIILENIQYNFTIDKKKAVYLWKLFADFFYSCPSAEKFLEIPGFAYHQHIPEPFPAFTFICPHHIAPQPQFFLDMQINDHLLFLSLFYHR